MAAVVIIEDEQRIRELAAKALAARGHEVHTSATAMDGLQTVIGSSPDLVILDLGLPDLDGMELLKMIRAVSDVPVIVATARGEEPDIVLSLNAGADDHLVKPFSVLRLILDKDAERDEKGDDHDRRDRQRKESEPFPHAGSTILIPTPQTVCRYRLSAADSPSFRLSQDR